MLQDLLKMFQTSAEELLGSNSFISMQKKLKVPRFGLLPYCRLGTEVKDSVGMPFQCFNKIRQRVSREMWQEVRTEGAKGDMKYAPWHEVIGQCSCVTCQ